LRISFEEKMSMRIAGKKNTASPNTRPCTADPKMGFEKAKASMQPAKATVKSRTRILDIEGKARVRTSL